MSKEDILDEGHWISGDFRQRMTTSNWRELLLNYDTKLIFQGRVTQLYAKNLGYGVVEVSKVRS